MQPETHDRQELALRALLILCSLRQDWAGHLILSLGLHPAGEAFALAANIAGAACLALDSSPDACRAALRSGAVDFAVNTLDEALRTLKNEIRKQRPLSVALAGETSSTLSEVLDRGVLPTLFLAFSSSPEPASLPAAESLHSLGTVVLASTHSTDAPAFALFTDHLLQAFLAAQGISLETFSFASSSALRSFDEQALQALPPRGFRHAWASSAPRYFYRGSASEPRLFRRILPLTPGELEQLKSLV